MKKLWTRKLLAFAMSLCLLVGAVSVAGATQAQSSDFDALIPLLDLIAASAYRAGDEPEIVGNEETTLTPMFVASLFNVGLTADASLGFTEAMLTNPDQQAVVLGKLFTAKLPQLETIAKTEPASGYIGFQPVTVNATAEGDTQIIGEVYQGAKPASQMSDEEYKEVTWLDRAVYTLRASADGIGGYKVAGFSVGAELNMEEAMQNYTESILMEYINTTLGFSILYPSVFTDDMLIEDGDGVSAQLADGSLRFFVNRVANSGAANLADYTGVIAQGIPGAKYALNESIGYATLTYDTQDGYTVFDMYIITDKYIYQAELSYTKELARTYQLYTAYMENSFSVDELSVG